MLKCLEETFLSDNKLPVSLLVCLNRIYGYLPKWRASLVWKILHPVNQEALDYLFLIRNNLQIHHQYQDMPILLRVQYFVCNRSPVHNHYMIYRNQKEDFLQFEANHDIKKVCSYN